MPPWFLHSSSILPGKTKNRSKKRPCPLTGAPPNVARRIWKRPGRRNMGKSSHGYKLSVCVDRKHKLIRKWMMDTASVHDSQHFDAVLDDWNTSAEVYADRGYLSQERGEQLKAQGYRGAYPTQRQPKPSALQMPATAKPQHRQSTGAGRTRLCSCRTNGWQAYSDHRPGTRKLRDDHDGRNLQHQAPDLSRKGADQSRSMPVIRKIRGKQP